MADDLANFIETQKRKLEQERAEFLRGANGEVRKGFELCINYFINNYTSVVVSFIYIIVILLDQKCCINIIA